MVSDALCKYSHLPHTCPPPRIFRKPQKFLRLFLVLGLSFGQHMDGQFGFAFLLSTSCLLFPVRPSALPSQGQARSLLQRPSVPLPDSGPRRQLPLAPGVLNRLHREEDTPAFPSLHPGLSVAMSAGRCPFERLQSRVAWEEPTSAFYPWDFSANAAYSDLIHQLGLISTGSAFNQVPVWVELFLVVVYLSWVLAIYHTSAMLSEADQSASVGRIRPTRVALI